MKKIDTHGLTIANLKEVSAMTNWPRNCGGRTAIAYDPAEGRLLVEDLMSENDTIAWVDGIVPICYAAGRIGQQKLADIVAEAMEHRDA